MFWKTNGQTESWPEREIMNKKNIGRVLHRIIENWIESIENEEVREIAKHNTLVTGGALVSLLCGETPNDYDVYFKTREACLAVVRYYAEKWNDEHPDETKVEVYDEDSRVFAFIRSAGIVEDDGIDDESEPYTECEESKEKSKEKYRVRYIARNAISLSDKIQIVSRFYGSIDEIHKNYDFIHCTCSYDHETSEVRLPEAALTAIINKELYYVGSKYPLCSIIRARKFITRGWTINAGQYVKMCLQLQALDLHDPEVLSEQLTGVDSAYFAQAIDAIREERRGNPSFRPDDTYLFELINKIF